MLMHYVNYIYAVMAYGYRTDTYILVVMDYEDHVTSCLVLFITAVHVSTTGLFDNTVTFNMHDGVLLFPTFQANNAGDIWLQFKTTATDGVLVHCTGSVDFIELRLFREFCCCQAAEQQVTAKCSDLLFSSSCVLITCCFF